ncbi:tail fiber assembly protein [Pseudomonas qingdaonensis]|uniref:tail fiber assembly protein n=1 Tax=Pseudomonas qingdaonensis TaxID=2056231 RepID=UPI003681BCE5
MPYAADGAISTEPFAGAIEISEEQHIQAVEGMLGGMAVSIEGGILSLRVPMTPEHPAEVSLTPDELRHAALAQRDALMAAAAARMAPLQYAADLGEATATEEAAMLAWKRYCVALNRIEQQTTYPESIVWPESPGIATTA